MKNTILFDLDGTLTKSELGITKSIQYALKHFDISVDNLDELCKYIGPPLENTFAEAYGFDKEKAIEGVEKYREYFLEYGMYENELYDGIESLLKTLKQLGKTLILATTKPTEQAQKILSHFNLDSYFSFVGGAENNGERSQKGEIIQYALDNLNIKDLSDCIMVGDRKYDIIGANSVGIESIGVLYGYGSAEELCGENATHIVQSVKELSELLCNQG